MKNKIKKNRLKIFIALSLMITCLFGVMFATNTFAYQTDTFSYTIDNLELNSSYNSWTYESETHTFYSPYNTNGYFSFYAYLKTNNNTTGKKAFLMNYNIYRSNDNTNWILWQQQNANAVVSVYNSNTNTNNLICRGQTKQNTYNYNEMYTIYASPYSNNNNSIETYNNKNRVLVYGEYFANGITNQYLKIEIVNIDFVSVENVSLSQYYDTYISNIEENYNQLLEDYNDLEANYDSLNDNYTQLESDYNDLESNYETLNQNYNNLNNATNNGIWTYIQTLDIGDTLQSESYNQQELTNNNILNNLRLELTNTYTDLPNITNYTAFLVFGNYGDNIFPLNLLEFNINTNRQITQFEIHVSTSDNGTYTGQNAKSIFITNEMLVRMNNQINKLNLQEQLNTLFTDNYVVDYIMIDWTKNNNTDIMTLISSNNQYTIGYQQGLAQGNTNAENQVNQLNNRINELIDRIESLEQTIETKNEQIALYSRASYGLNNLMWTIGGTPFESFKQIWNVEFLGVDIANFILGIITTFIGLYIVKKFFL